MLRKTWKKRFTAYLCGILAATCALGSIPVSAVSGSGRATQLINIAQGCSYTSISDVPAQYPDNGNKELTDGIVGGASMWDGNWVGYSGNSKAVEVIIDLGETKDFSTVEVVSLNSVDNGGIGYPAGFTFSTSTDSLSWDVIHSGQIPADAPKNSTYTYSYTSPSILSTRYLKVSFPASYWSFIGEIRALGELSAEADANNILQNVKYTTSLRDGGANAGKGDFHDDLPDVKREKLTDGFRAGTNDWRDLLNVGFHTPMLESVTDKSIDVTFLFDGAKSFQQINIGAFQEQGVIYLPKAIHMEYLDADGNWQLLYNGNLPASSKNKIEYVYVAPDASTITAQGIRFYFTAHSDFDWMILDEIKALAISDGTTANINPPVGTLPQKPIITVDLPTEKAVSEGDAVTLSVKAEISDVGTMTYQWYKDETAIGTSQNTFDIPSAALADAGNYSVKVTNTIGEASESTTSKICALTVERAAATPQITTNLDAEKSVEVGNTITLKIAASVTDGGTLSYQWYKNGAAVGTNSDTFTIASAVRSDTGSYKVKVTNTREGLMKSVDSATCAVTVTNSGQAENKNLLKGLTYVTSLKDGDANAGKGDFHGDHPDVARTRLTDGIKGTSYSDSATIGYHVGDNPIDLTFALGGVKTFQEIQIGAFAEEKSSIALPDYIKIQAKNGEGDWKTIFEGKTKGKDAKKVYVFATLDDTSITATDLRFYLTGGNSWLFLDEIETFEKTTGTLPFGDLDPEFQIANNNLVLGLPYESVTAAHQDYPDTDHKEITDGKTAGLSFYNANWSAYIYMDTADFIFDLGEAKTFEEVKLNTLQDTRPAIFLPTAVNVYTSDNKADWKLVSATGIGTNDTPNMVYNFKTTTYKPETARYVKVSVIPRGWFFVDEIEILAKSEDKVDDSANNVAYHAAYQSNPAADSAHPDSAGLTKLTDGRTGSANFSNASWVGYGTSSTDTEIIVDLGNSTNFEQVDINFLNDSNNNIALPARTIVYYSADKSSWELLAQKDIAPISTQAPLVYTMQCTGTITANARYVKVVFPAAEKVFLDEIKVLMNRTLLPDGGTDPEFIDDNNIAYECDYTTSWEAETKYADSGKELTNGKRATYLYTGLEWSGYAANQEKTPFTTTVDLGSIKSFEQVQMGFLQSQSRLLSIYYPTNVKVEYSSDNASWKTFANESMDSEGNGIQRFSYAAAAVSGRYVRFTVEQNGFVFIDEIQIYRNQLSGGDYEENPDGGPSYNLVRAQNYIVSRSADYRSTQGLLSDGKYGITGTKYDQNWTGFKRSDSNETYNHIQVTFDMGVSNSVSEISLSTRNDPANHLTLPKNLAFWASQNGKDWAKVANIAPPELSGNLQKVNMAWSSIDGFKSRPENATMLYTRYVRIDFDVPSSGSDYAYLDEIKVIGKRGKCSTSGEAMDEKGFYNVALGKPYTMNLLEPNSLEPDIDGKQITDGIIATTNARDPAWVSLEQEYQPGGIYTNRRPLKTFEIDLQGTKSITSVQANFLSQEFSYQPWAVFTYTSMDGKTWTPLSRTTNVDMWIGGRYGYGWRGSNDLDRTPTDYIDLAVPAVATNYVRVDVEMLHTNMIDEIEVFGYDGIIDGAIVTENGRNLDTGRDYQKPSEKTGDIQDMVLCYNGDYGIDKDTGIPRGSWNADQYRPYLTYIDPQGEAKDTMFDAVCLLALYSQYGRAFNQDVADGTHPPQFEDWEWYLDKIFKKGGDVDELNKAARIASQELNDPNYKTKLVIMHPGPDLRCKNFGPLDGKYYNLNDNENWKIASDWWYREVLSRFAEGGYERLEFEGFYWLSEQVGFRPDVVEYNTNKVHELGYKMYWIPFFFANGYLWGDDVGFDAVAYQPNHFFADPEVNGYGMFGTGQVDNAAMLASYGKIGMEIEMDDRAFTTISKYNQYLDYLNSAVKNGFDGPGVYRNWYQGLRAFGTASNDRRLQQHSLYDYVYQVMNGTYTTKEYITDFTGTMIGDGTTPDVGGDTIGGGGGGGGGIRPRPDPENPETPSVGKNTWEKTSSGYKLKDANGKYITGWAKEGGKWYYLKSDGVMVTGWQKINNAWYYLNSSGAMATGWQKVGSTWYFMNADGSMKTGWLKQGNTWYYLNGSGAMKTGWNWIGGKCYYFDASGKMATNTTIGKYKVNASGEWIK